jgi:Flp pilus assembly protein TadG
VDEDGLNMRKLLKFPLLKDDRGTTAVEFAIVSPAFIAMVVGTLYMCLLLYGFGSLQFAVEDAARCASVKTATCSDSATTISYAQSHYSAAGVLNATFAYATPACGHSVTATANYIFNFGLTKVTFPVSAAACFP